MYSFKERVILYKMSTSLVDLNSTIVSLLSCGSVTDIKSVMECSLDIHLIIKEIIRTKRYDTLPLFLHLLPVGAFDHEFAKIYAQALLDEDEETTEQLDCLDERLNHNLVSFYYGTLTTSAKTHPLCESCSEEYLDGLISVDNLELFLFFEGTHWNPSFPSAAAKYGATRTMDHLGYAEYNIKMYVQSALSVRNKQTIDHLFEKIGFRVRRFTRNCIHRISFVDPSFVKWLLEEGYYSPTKKDTERLKEEQPELYTALQADA